MSNSSPPRTRSHRVSASKGRILFRFSPAYAERLRNLGDSQSKKRKYGRHPETEAMRQLRTAATAALREQLQLNANPDRVRFIVEPYPKKNTAYLWGLLDDVKPDELKVYNATMNAARSHSRWPANWTDEQRDVLANLIKSKRLVPKFYDRTLSIRDLAARSESQSICTSVETEMSSDSDGADDDSKDGDYQPVYEPSDGEESERSEKRQKRHESVPIGAFNDDLEISPTADISTCPNQEREKTPEPPNDAASPGCPIVEVRSRPHSPEISRPPDYIPQNTSKQSTPPQRGPRIMTLNAAGILDLDPSSITIPAVRTWSSGLAPIAASPVTLPTPTETSTASSSETGTSFSSHTSMSPIESVSLAIKQFDAESEEDEAAKHVTLECVNDMRACMQGFLDHAIVGYLQTLNQRREIRNLKRENVVEHDGLRKTIQDLLSDQDKLRKTIQDLLNDQDKLESQIGRLQQDNEVYANLNRTSKETINALEEDNATITAERDSHRREIGSLRAELESLQKQHRRVEESLASSTTNEYRLNGELEQIRKDESRLNKDLDVVREEKQTLAINKDALTAQVEKLLKEIESLRAENSNLQEAQEKDVAARISKEEDLNAQVRTLQKEKSDLESNIARFRKQIIDFFPILTTQ
ncbi:hypothetical protein TWF696_009647 [Orbilia brochopaga]|uniref:Uncharacterized protein n=1 Tax=Orbilia brochopaga TaxID=3140254 RepID=A0AAV9UDE8_9PEZI